MLTPGLVDEVVIWGVKYPSEWPRDGDKPARVEFYVKPKGQVMGGSEAFFICKADFVLDPDGQ